MLYISMQREGNLGIVSNRFRILHVHSQRTRNKQDGQFNTGRFIMFSVITNMYNKKAKGPTLMELFTATGKTKKFFLQLEMFDGYTTGDTAHIDPSSE
jgi:hypothetical protein